MTRRELWKTLKDGPAEYRPLIEGALMHRFGFFEVYPRRRIPVSPLDALNPAWLGIIHTVDPVYGSVGPAEFPEELLQCLAQRATFGMTIGAGDLDPLKWLSAGPVMGARVLVVETNFDHPSSDEWEDFLDDNVSGRSDHWQRQPGTHKRILKVVAASDAERRPCARLT